MRHILFFTFALASIFIKAQVGINTNTPNPNSALHIEGNNQGILIPKINLNDRTSTSQFAIQPKESLMFYNTNPNISGGKAFYFWNGNRWDFVFNDTNINMVQNLIAYETAETTSTYTNSSYNTVTHSKGDNLDNTWTELSDLRQTINVTRENNSLLFTVSGMIQANNGSTDGTAQILIGVFMNDKLVAMSPIYFKMSGSCAYRSFKVISAVEGSTIGSKEIKIGMKNISKTFTNDVSINYGKSFSSCSNLSDNEAKISASTLLNQPFNF